MAREPAKRPMPARKGSLIGPLAFIGLALAIVAGVDWWDKRSGVEFAPSVANISPPPASASRERAGEARSTSGPCFVDRARDFGLDVITRCGSPEKPSLLHALGSGVALFDFDGDGDLDLFVAGGSGVTDGKVRCAGGPWLFRNDGPGRWIDVSATSGLAWTGWAQGVAVADYDGDGDPDLFVAQHGPDALWQNQGDGTFRDVTVEAGLRENFWGVGATWGDADGDGWPDLYVTNYVQIDPIHPPPLHDHIGGVKVFPGPGMLPGEPDQFWRNKGDGTFEDKTASAGLHDPNGKGMAALFVDLDGDAILDLFVTNDGQANQLFRGLGRGKFRDEAMEVGVALSSLGAPEGSMGADVADLDGDGRLDLLYTNFRHEGTRICLARPSGIFYDASNDSRVANYTISYVAWGLVAADFDDDGWPDLFQADGHIYPNTPDSNYDQPPLFLRNHGHAEFEDSTAAWGQNLDALRSGRSVAAGDLDGDGDIDLVMTTIDGPLRILVNEGRGAGHSVNVRLAGRHPNLEALGARVEIQAGGRTQVGVVRRGGSFMGASDVALHFGLGPVETIERILVTWPDGSSADYHDLRADALLMIRQGEPKVVSIPFRPRDAGEISKR